MSRDDVSSHMVAHGDKWKVGAPASSPPPAMLGILMPLHRDPHVPHPPEFHRHPSPDITHKLCVDIIV